jgi:hypothetical protein
LFSAEVEIEAEELDPEEPLLSEPRLLVSLPSVPLPLPLSLLVELSVVMLSLLSLFSLWMPKPPFELLYPMCDSEPVLKSMPSVAAIAAADIIAASRDALFAALIAW